MLLPRFSLHRPQRQRLGTIRNLVYRCSGSVNRELVREINGPPDQNFHGKLVLLGFRVKDFGFRV